jgi:hypothetical protein
MSFNGKINEIRELIVQIGYINELILELMKLEEMTPEIQEALENSLGDNEQCRRSLYELTLKIIEDR